jgi:DNA repair protein RadA/Sms
MAKIKSKWVCQNCGYESAGYLGKCPECSGWGTFVEEIQNDIKKPNIFLCVSCCENSWIKLNFRLIF